MWLKLLEQLLTTYTPLRKQNWHWLFCQSVLLSLNLTIHSKPNTSRYTCLWWWSGCKKARCPRSCRRRGHIHGKGTGRSLTSSVISFGEISTRFPPQRSPACRRRSLQRNTLEPGQTWGKTGGLNKRPATKSPARTKPWTRVCVQSSVFKKQTATM